MSFYPLFLRKRGIRPVLLLAVTCLALIGSVGEASAYPWMIRHHYTACSTCHTDPSGGGQLTRYGRLTGDVLLSTQYGSQESRKKEPKQGFLWGAVQTPDALLLNTSFRNLYIYRPGNEGDRFVYIPVMQLDGGGEVRFGQFFAGGTIGLGKVREGVTFGRAAQVTTNQGGEMNLLARKFYVGLNLGQEWILRAGRLNLPFGIRIPEHTMWVRQATRTDIESQQQYGVAAAYVGDNVRAEVMAIVGNYQVNPDTFRERGYSLLIEGIGGSSFAAGISSKVTYAGTDRLTFEENTVRQAHGVTARWGPTKSLGFLFEMDALFRSKADAGYVGYLQTDYEPIQGLHFMATGEI
ncbi:MAG: hypothetical protein MK135_15520, partial [Polyangiaceae bacterium]|nr:hypothetical protein [Polyangiaceae bacterium]